MNASAMQLEAISIDSESSEETVPSVAEVERKSIMASARRFLEVTVAFVRTSVTAYLYKRDEAGYHCGSCRELECD